MEWDRKNILSKSHQDTHEWGKRLAALLKSGDVIALFGDLGTGKTTFTQGVCAGLDVTQGVTSPSFTLIQEYEGRLPVFHFDFYRLESVAEIEDLDIDSYLMAGGVCIVEWAERGEPLLPEDRISVMFDRVSRNGDFSVHERTIRIVVPRGRGLMSLRA
jgi:tRNA threonylcarbamoyladenosine biosynthesis protein TsaE